MVTPESDGPACDTDKRIMFHARQPTPHHQTGQALGDVGEEAKGMRILQRTLRAKQRGPCLLGIGMVFAKFL